MLQINIISLLENRTLFVRETNKASSIGRSRDKSFATVAYTIGIFPLFFMDVVMLRG
jgi:hypothetical protein